MDRLTSHEISDLMEAYNAVYAPKEEVVEEEVEQIDEIVRPTTGQQTAPKTAPAPAAKPPQVAGGGMGGRRGSGSSPSTSPKPISNAPYQSRFARPMNAGTPQQTGRGTSVSRPPIGGLPSNYRGQELQAGARAAASQVGTPRQGSAGTGAAPSAAARPAARPAPSPATRPAAAPAAAPAAPKTAPTTPTSYAGVKPATNAFTGNASIGTPTSAPKPVNKLMTGMPSVPSTAAPAAATPPAAAKPNLQQQIRQRRLNMDLDLFDVIKGHLLDEGYADTEEAALVIMANMSEDWRQSILEADSIDAMRKRAAKRREQRYGKNGGGGRDDFRPYTQDDYDNPKPGYGSGASSQAKDA